MQATDVTDVLVVGAGPTGLALACDLLQRGVTVAIVEQRAEPATTSRAFALQARGLEILEDVGAGHVAQHASVVTGVTTHAAGRPLTRVRFGGLSRTGHPGVYLVSQADVEAALRDRLAEFGVRVRFGHRLTHAADCGDSVEATIETSSDGEVATRARWLVGCDGANSTVRDLADIPFEGGTLPETFLLADLDLDIPFHEREVATFLHADGVVGLFPLPTRGVWRLVAQADDGAAKFPDDVGEVMTILQDLLVERTGRSDVRVVGARWWSRFRIHRRLAARYRTGRVLLAGDAAHVHSPFGGQGMNVGLGDAGNLGWKLAEMVRGRAGLALLESYEQERRPVAAEVVEFTTGATRFATGSGTGAQMLRDRVLPLVARARPEHPTAALAPPRVLLERFAQLRVRYRSGPLAAPATGAAGVAARTLPGPRPGDRAPDGTVISLAAPTSERTTLRRIVAGRWALLSFGPPSPEQQEATRTVTRYLADDVVVVRLLPPAASFEPRRWRDGRDAQVVEVLVEDHGGLLRTRYRPRGSASILVRPDGHVGWRSGWFGPSLDGWLASIFGPPPTS